jgi:FAD/FMN-containing dehydrogenase
MLAGWGRLPVPGRELLTDDLAAATVGAALSRGLGRSYGDASLPATPEDKIINTRLAGRILGFDERTGLLRAEAGLSLDELLHVFMPRGWFVPVTPGTRFVTLGGAVASDVHGKNHHVAGCFGAHVQALRLRLGEGDLVECSPSLHPDLFWATVGGMGLTGHILEVAVSLVRIPSQWVWTESTRVGNIGEFLAVLAAGAHRLPMTMGWIDCLSTGSALGRGIFMGGRWATPGEAGERPPPRPHELTLPLELPGWVVSHATARAFNAAVYLQHGRKDRRRVRTPAAFFWPLDAIHEWNRGYGRGGFTQYQCVIPKSGGVPAVREFMQLLARLGAASPLCVIKDCGPEGQGLLSFPLEGTSIAVDMAVTSDIQKVVDELNAFVIAAGGRIYLSKDRFTRREHFRAMEPRLPAFLAARAKWDPHHRLRSAQSVRLLGDLA